jgi:hypothetical protein
MWFTKCEEEPLLLRHRPALKRRLLIYFCSGAYTDALHTAGWQETLPFMTYFLLEPIGTGGDV